MRSIIVVCVSSILLAVLCLSCDRAGEKASPQEECLTRPSVNHGKIVEGQYIVTYRSDSGR